MTPLQIVLPFLQDIEEFVQSSGDDGIVVFSLGSFINNITTEKANMVAAALAQIPQKVREEPWQVLLSIYFSPVCLPMQKKLFTSVEVWFECQAGLCSSNILYLYCLRKICFLNIYSCL